MVDREHCCGCAVCEAVCPAEAIVMAEDAEGFLYPVVDEKRCVNCSVCAAHCPAEKNAFALDAHGIACSAAHLDDERLLLQSASGGAATALAKTVLDSGGVVFGVAYDRGFRSCRHTMAKTEEALIPLKGSKYIQSDKEGVYAGIKQKLWEGLQVLFIGLPCEVGAVKAYLGGNDENLLTCELICHGVTSRRVAREFIDHLEAELGGKLNDFTLRLKKDVWMPPYVAARAESGGEYVRPFFDTAYGYAFEYYLRPSCYRCVYKGENRVADLTVGDFQGMEPDHPGYEKSGVSALMANTQKGLEAIGKLKGLCMTPVDYAFILNGNKRLYASARIKPERETFGQAFERDGLIAAYDQRKKGENRATPGTGI